MYLFPGFESGHGLTWLCCELSYCMENTDPHSHPWSSNYTEIFEKRKFKMAKKVLFDILIVMRRILGNNYCNLRR
jgi:hypothetical protein